MGNTNNKIDELPSYKLSSYEFKTAIMAVNGNHEIFISTMTDYNSIIDQIINLSLTEFKTAIAAVDNWSETSLNILAVHLTKTYYRCDYMQILVDAGFVITDDFIKKNATSFSTTDMFETINNIIGYNSFNCLDKLQLEFIFRKAYERGHFELAKKIIDYGFDINDIIDKEDLLMVTNRYQYQFFSMMLDLGFNFVITPKILCKFIRSEPDFIKMLIDRGINFDKLHSITVPNLYTKSYALLSDLDIDPKIIGYILSQSTLW